MTPVAETDPRWLAVLARDASADDPFVYAVRTTGLYCPPGSPARQPRRENVEFFDSAELAEAAGYRPSRHAIAQRTRQAHTALVTRACQLLEAAASPPSLAELAAELSLSPFHFHRLFKRFTGLTPKAYADAQRARRVREQLKPGGSVTEALYEAGFNANSRFYESSNQRLGMKPVQFRNGGARATIRFALGSCSLGDILVAASERGICAILLGDDAEQLLHDLQDSFANAELIGADPQFEQWVAQVVGFVEAPGIGLELPLDVRGTAFQERVWQALRDIPVGSTASYAEVARQIGAPTATRAVAQACGANRLAVAIPCHRVVRSDGALSGYRWGVERKRRLLEREAR